MSSIYDITANEAAKQKDFPTVIYYIEGKLVAEEHWIRGLTKFSNKESAEEDRATIQRAFDQYCRWPMETRVAETEGNILDRRLSN